MDPKEHSQQTPFGALFLHWLFTIIMIVATIHLRPQDAYGVLVNLYSYTIVAIFGFAIAIGMLKLRFSSHEQWRIKSSFNHYASIISAFTFAVGSAYPIVASWVPPTGSFSKQTKLALPWFTTPTVAWSILGFGLVWYFGFLLIARRRLRKYGLEYHVEKEPNFENDPEPDGPPIQTHEKVCLRWMDKEYTRPEGDMEEARMSRESF